MADTNVVGESTVPNEHLEDVEVGNEENQSSTSLVETTTTTDGIVKDSSIMQISNKLVEAAEVVEEPFF
ncbi:unnamed protein product [Arabis nemorensis]|uniref:Uncharacterized protein n=1 Tax=Arabis nemorensis TaxID=586526 RepID=A0A565BM00_9BRAS|nr:unnamed protein product [Arabis nemorensis]